MSWKVGSKDNSARGVVPSFDKLQQFYLEFLTTYEVIVNYELKLHSISLEDYNKERVEKQRVIQGITILLENINKLRKELSLDLKLDEVKKKQLKLIADNMIKKHEDLEATLNSIIIHEKSLNKRFSLYQLNAGKDIRSSIVSSNVQIENNETITDDLRKSLSQSYSEKFEELNIEDNNFILEQREKELHEILAVSNHIKDMTTNMKSEVATQGKLLDKLDNTIVEVKQNVINADLNIQIAETETKSKTTYILITAGIAFVLIGIIILIIKLI